MYILGLATMGESAAALLKDGVLVAAVEEERFSRHKHEGCFPLRSIRYCLDSAGIELEDVAYVGVYWQPWRVFTRAKGVLGSAISNPGNFLYKIKRTFEEFKGAGGGHETNSSGSWFELFRVKQILEKNFGSFPGKVRYLDHHLCHGASAFFCSPFDESVILTFDGGGEEATTTVAHGAGNKIKVMREFKWPHSLGHFYSSMTGFLGFKMLDGEYKMMGLAPHGTARYRDAIRKNYLISDAPGSYQLNNKFLDYHGALTGNFRKEAISILGEPRPEDENAEFNERHADLAASAQASFEEVVTDIAHWAIKQTGGTSNICIAGGCGLNGTANGKLLLSGAFGRIYVPPAPHDAGAAVGAALLIHYGELGHERKFVMDHAYFGPAFKDEEIAQALKTHRISAEPLPDENSLLEKTVSVLTDSGVVAWFQGRMEFGPRALGSRSFLADPRNDSIRDVINAKIKKRELFRPFAPSVKEEHKSEYFDLNQDANFMNIVVPVRQSKRSAIPAVTHIDGTARPQTVSRKNNPRYWNLIDRFEKKSGVPVLLNTSFNIQEPIVCAPADAVQTFINSRVDALAIGNYFVTREQVA